MDASIFRKQKIRSNLVVCGETMQKINFTKLLRPKFIGSLLECLWNFSKHLVPPLLGEHLVPISTSDSRNCKTRLQYGTHTNPI